MKNQFTTFQNYFVKRVTKVILLHGKISCNSISALFRGFKISDYNLFDNNVSNFVHNNVLEQQIEHNFQQQIANVKHGNPFRSVKINLIKNQHGEDLNAVKALKKKRKNQRENLLKMLKQN